MPDLQTKVQGAYDSIAQDPAGKTPFPAGRRLALALGYPAPLLDSLPGITVEAFCGVSNVSIFADLPPGSRVLDLGCGAGLDTLIAARRAGSVIGLDFSPQMLGRAQQALEQSGLSNVTFRSGLAQQIPLPDASIDRVLVNGIFNLSPHRAQILGECWRVLRPEGELFGAEIILNEPLSDDERHDEANWFT